ncbi:MAG TPA: zf-HC2 domain-containing protein [Gemmatimonadales bacterium]|nr:zf-HC2 domain-containing protein [Gemmatimonadales bacterium]
MSHPDDGTIQMLLDGELAGAERARLEAHFAGCEPCAARLAEARAFLEEADRLVELVVVPPGPARRRRPVRRQALVRTLAWAASVVLAVAVGYYGRGEPAPGALPTVAATAPSEAPAAGGAPATAGQPAVDAPTPLARTNPAPAAPVQDEAKAAAQNPPPAGANRQGVAVGQAPAKPELRDDRLREAAKMAAPPSAAALTDAAAVTPWRVVSMEEGVRLLGGQIRLIDGLTPDRVEAGPGTAVAGADGSLPVVRIVYGAGSIALDQQRPPVAAAERRAEASSALGAAASGGMVPGWSSQGAIRFVVTGSVSPESLQTLAGRVR